MLVGFHRQGACFVSHTSLWIMSQKSISRQASIYYKAVTHYIARIERVKNDRLARLPLTFSNGDAYKNTNELTDWFICFINTSVSIRDQFPLRKRITSVKYHLYISIYTKSIDWKCDFFTYREVLYPSVYSDMSCAIQTDNINPLTLCESGLNIPYWEQW